MEQLCGYRDCGLRLIALDRGGGEREPTEKGGRKEKRRWPNLTTDSVTEPVGVLEPYGYPGTVPRYSYFERKS